MTCQCLCLCRCLCLCADVCVGASVGACSCVCVLMCVSVSVSVSVQNRMLQLRGGWGAASTSGGSTWGRVEFAMAVLGSALYIHGGQADFVDPGQC